MLYKNTVMQCSRLPVSWSEPSSACGIGECWLDVEAGYVRDACG